MNPSWHWILTPLWCMVQCSSPFQWSWAGSGLTPIRFVNWCEIMLLGVRGKCVNNLLRVVTRQSMARSQTCNLLIANWSQRPNHHTIKPHCVGFFAGFSISIHPLPEYLNESVQFFSTVLPVLQACRLSGCLPTERTLKTQINKMVWTVMHILYR